MSNSRTNVDLLRNLIASLGGSSTAQIDALLLLLGSSPTLHGTITLGTSAADTINQVGLTTGRAAATTYTPTLTAVVNVASSTLRAAWYARSNDIVHVDVICDIDPTAASATTLAISLPVASDLASVYDASGIGVSDASEVGIVQADATNNRVNYTYTAAGTGSTQHRIQFSYRVL